MAKRNYNSDYMSRKMDRDLEQLEERLTALYTRAANEVTAEFTDFMSDYEKKYVQMTRLYEHGDITETEYSNWCKRQIIQTDRYKDTVKSLTNTLVKTDVAAMGMVNGQLPLTIAQSYNFVQALGFESTNMPIGVFQIYNADTVREIIKENPDILPNVDIPEDKKWNKDRINSEIVQGIVQGHSIPEVAQRLQNVTNMDKNAAVRNARTAMTGAENLGRTKSAENLRSKGIPVKEQWHATMDSRTRDTHLLLDGTFKDENGYYGASFLSKPLRFPADPLGAPEEIYNCRCREGVVLAGIDHSQDDDLYEQFMKDNYPNDWKAIQESEREQARRTEVGKTKEYQSVLKEIQEKGYYEIVDVNPTENKENPKDFISEKNADVSSKIKESGKDIEKMSYEDIKKEFINDPSSYIYDTEYNSMQEERKEIIDEDMKLWNERKDLQQELISESTIKPREKWTEDEEFYASLLGDKPTEYTKRGEEIVERTKEIDDIRRNNDARLSELNTKIDRIDKANYIEQSKEWNNEVHTFVVGDINKEYQGFSTTMDITQFDNDLKNGVGFIAEMSPDEYLDRIAYDIFHTTKEKAIVCDYENVKIYAKMMSEGTKFDMGYLDYSTEGQEGRHRAMAAQLLGIKTIPVYIRGV